MRGILITLTGPSCAGKTTLEENLINRGFARVISNTSRAPRKGEVDGVHYRFQSRLWFEEMQRAGGFVEFVEFNGNYYGNTKQDILDAMKRGQGKVAWVIEPKGLKQVRKWFVDGHAPEELDLLSVFVDGSQAEIMRRFMLRWRESGCPDAHLSRLDAMLGIERQWVTEARAAFDRGDLYEIVLDRYDDSNDETVHELLDNIAYSATMLKKQVA